MAWRPWRIFASLSKQILDACRSQVSAKYNFKIQIKVHENHDSPHLKKTDNGRTKQLTQWCTGNNGYIEKQQEESGSLWLEALTSFVL